MRTETYGGTNGVSFDDSHAIEEWGAIRRIVVRSGARVDAITMFWASGRMLSHGGSGGALESTIALDPDEFIQQVRGRAGSQLDQITFVSNKRTYGPYGGSGGEAFACDFADQVLHFLFGRSGSEVDQIGFGYGAQPPRLPVEIVASSAQGGAGGTVFDDLAGGALGRITTIRVGSGSGIDSVAIGYNDGSIPAHGGGGGTLHTFSLDPDESIIEVRGRAGDRVDQLQFFTNKNRATPVYGGSGGTAFKVTAPAGQVIRAIFGRSGSRLDRIGFYIASDVPSCIGSAGTRQVGGLTNGGLTVEVRG